MAGFLHGCVAEHFVAPAFLQGALWCACVSAGSRVRGATRAVAGFLRIGAAREFPEAACPKTPRIREFPPHRAPMVALDSVQEAWKAADVSRIAR